LSIATLSPWRKAGTAFDAFGRQCAAAGGGFLRAFFIDDQACHRGLRRALADTTYLIDSTGLRLDERSAGWARFSTGVCGAKVHVIYDAGADRPIYAEVSAARVHDITLAQQMPIEPGATYVFDLGYYDYRWWAKLNDAGCRIVTRFKKNTPLRLLKQLRVPKHGPVLSDCIGFLPAARQMNNSRNPFQMPSVKFALKPTPARSCAFCATISMPPPSRSPISISAAGPIELFFRWVKQTSKIRHFLGTSENAVRIQIAVALIGFLLLRLTQAIQKTIDSPLAFARLIRVNLMHRRRIDRLLRPEDPPQSNGEQMTLQWT